MEKGIADQEYKVCHMCWMDKPLYEFLNRFQTRYCKICRTCRSGQLLRYYGVRWCAGVICREKEVNNQDQGTEEGAGLLLQAHFGTNDKGGETGECTI